LFIEGCWDGVGESGKGHREGEDDVGGLDELHCEICKYLADVLNGCIIFRHQPFKFCIVLLFCSVVWMSSTGKVQERTALSICLIYMWVDRSGFYFTKGILVVR